MSLSEIRVNTTKTRTGVGTITYTETGPVITGIATASNFKTGSTNVHSTGVELANINTGGSTATFGGPISGTTATLSGALSGTTATFSGNVIVGGVLTYEDVTNIDSVGILTARAGIKLTQTQSTINLDTSDGSDNKYISIHGGGAASQSRGAGISLYGNEVTNHQGRLQLLAGNSGNTNGVIQFHTGGSERLHIDANGDVLFHNYTDNIGSSSSGEGFEFRRGEALRLQRSGGLPLIVNRIADDGDLITLRRDGSGKADLGIRNNALTFDVGGSERLRIPSSGGVGINTTLTRNNRFLNIAAPSQDFSSGSTNLTDGGGIMFQPTDTLPSTNRTYPGIFWSGNTASLGRVRAGILGVTAANNDATDIVFLTRHAANGTSFFPTDERLRIKSNGSIWIGSSTQYGNNAFNISNGGTIITSSGQNTLKLIDSTAQAADVGARILLGGNYRSSGDASPMVELKSFKENGTDNNYAYGFKVSTTPNGGSLTERFHIDSSGNIGINEASPQRALHIGAGGVFRFERGDGTRYGELWNDNSFVELKASTDPIRLNAQSYIRFDIAGGEKLRINSSGDLFARADSTVYLVLGSSGDATSSGANNNMNWIRGNATNVQYNCCGGFHAWENGGSEKMKLNGHNLELASASQCRITLGSQGTPGSNDSNWIRGDANNIMLNCADTSGEHIFEVAGTATARIYPGVGVRAENTCKAWLSYRSEAGQEGIIDDFFVASVTDEATGTFYVNLDGDIGTEDGVSYIFGSHNDGARPLQAVIAYTPSHGSMNPWWTMEDEGTRVNVMRADNNTKVDGEWFSMAAFADTI